MHSDNSIYIIDFEVSECRKGHGRTLINYFLEKIKKQNIEDEVEISGDLSPVDKDEFPWLIPFFESLGFTCILFDNPDGKMLGKVYMKL